MLTADSVLLSLTDTTLSRSLFSCLFSFFFFLSPFSFFFLACRFSSSDVISPSSSSCFFSGDLRWFLIGLDLGSSGLLSGLLLYEIVEICYSANFGVNKNFIATSCIKEAERGFDFQHRIYFLLFIHVCSQFRMDYFIVT